VSPPTVKIREVQAAVCLRQMMGQHIPNENAEKAIAESRLNNGDDLHSTNGPVLEKETYYKRCGVTSGKGRREQIPIRIQAMDDLDGPLHCHVSCRPRTYSTHALSSSSTLSVIN
jgi:hypothetical protein